MIYVLVLVACTASTMVSILATLPLRTAASVNDKSVLKIRFLELSFILIPVTFLSV